MPALRDVQAGMRAALLAGDERGLAGAVCEDGLPVPARLAVYRHHVFTSLTAVLEAAYPVVCRLVDRRFFAYVADRYIRAEPPAGPCLFEYGASLAEFLASFPPCRALAYLPDVARLEWAMNVALHAPDATPLDAAALAAVAPSSLRGLAPRLDPSVTLLRSRWPVDAIWRANQPEARDDTVSLAAGGVMLEVRRRGDEVVFRTLPAADFALRAALAGGATLLAAAQAALDADGALDLPAAIRALLDESLLVAS